MTRIRSHSIRIVIVGPSGAGKSTNLRALRDLLPPCHVGRLVEEGAGGFFEYLQLTLLLSLPNAPSIRLRVQVVGCRGSHAEKMTRRALIREANGVLFVAESRRAALERNKRSFDEVLEVLALSKTAPALFTQFNKRDLAEGLEEAALLAAESFDNEPVSEASARRGQGVLECFIPLLAATLRQSCEALDARDAVHFRRLDASDIASALLTPVPLGQMPTPTPTFANRT